MCTFYFSQLLAQAGVSLNSYCANIYEQVENDLIVKLWVVLVVQDSSIRLFSEQRTSRAAVNAL